MADLYSMGSQLGGVTLMLGGSSRFNESQLASVRKIALYTDSNTVPDPILPWIASPRQEERFRRGLLAQNSFPPTWPQ